MDIKTGPVLPILSSGGIVFKKKRVDAPNIAPPILDIQEQHLIPLLNSEPYVRSSEQAKVPMHEIMNAIDMNEKSINELPELFIDSVTISVLSSEDIVKISVVEITNPSLSGEQSVNDLRMGATDSYQVCPVCKRDNTSCTGHYGRIKLNEPIINPLCIRTLISVLKCICNEDGKLLVPYETLQKSGVFNMHGINRLKSIEKLSDNVYTCMCEPGGKRCAPNPHFDIEESQNRNMICYTERSKKAKKDVTPMMYYSIQNLIEILDGISEETLEILGFDKKSKPINYIMEYIPVVPNCARLASEQDGKIYPDEITKFYSDIVKANNQLAKKGSISPSEVDRNRLVEKVIEYVKLLFQGDKKKTQGKDKSIRSKLQGKSALPRAHLMGKRVDYSGRTVISPDPSLKFGQVRIPMKIAKVCTKPEVVTAQNKGALTQLLRGGRVNFFLPGPNSTLPKKYIGQRLPVNKERMLNYIPSIGDTFYRWLQNGDRVIINRQPTLSKNSFMSMEVVLAEKFQYVDGKYQLIEGPNTIGLHLGYTTSFNADFDKLSLSKYMGH
jgi:DNA-directed RNA polymerase II subunit RPB1